jgi:hypothetical protein
MSFRNACCLAIALFTLTVELPAQESLPVPVFVTSLETERPAPMKPEEHAAAFKRTREEWFAVAAQLRKEHGDNTNQWTPDVRQILDDAEDTHMLTLARRDYERADTQLAIADSVEDFVRGADGSKAIALVKNAEDASLDVQITGRRYAKDAGVYDPKYFVRYRLSPGPKMTAERFVELTRGYKWTSPFTKAFSRAKPRAMWVDLETGSPASYKNGAAIVRGVVENFIKATMDPAKKKK